MKSFRINEVERYSNVKAHTLRIWEQRYGFPKPSRNLVHCRTYSLKELTQILDLSILNKNGFRISFLQTLSAPQIEEKLRLLHSNQDQKWMVFRHLLVHMFSLDIHEFEEEIDKCFLRWPSNEVVKGIIFPFLEKTGLLWQGRQLTEEHLAASVIRKKLIREIEGLPSPPKTQQPVILFLPDTKQLDLALLYSYYHLKSEGVSVVYMGNDVSMLNICNVLEKLRPSYLFTYLSAKTSFSFDELSDVMSQLETTSTLMYTSVHNNQVSNSKQIVRLPYEQALTLLCGAGVKLHQHKFSVVDA